MLTMIKNSEDKEKTKEKFQEKVSKGEVLVFT